MASLRSMLPRVVVASVLGFALSGVVLAAACSKKSDLGPPVTHTTTSTHSNSTTGSGGQGGLGGGGTGGAGGTTSSGGSGGESPCAQDVAFFATGIAFSDPTAAPLAAALNEVSAGVHPVTLVLHLNAGTLTGALSATLAGGSGEVFPANKVPDFLTVVPAFNGGLTTVGPPGSENDPQQVGYLRVVDELGTTDIEIGHVRWVATPDATCSSLTEVVVDAFIAASELSHVLHLAGGDQTIGELAGYQASDAGANDSGVAGGPPNPGNLPQPIHFSFQGESVVFDYSTL
ncbi:MAG: hypothetical protein IT373_09715 [Polyangiaceae bacterium]|nr:hypothetical protein [Polyangiaceae bacterium]